jgi:hypothetical protein
LEQLVKDETKICDETLNRLSNDEMMELLARRHPKKKTGDPIDFN